MRLRTKVLNWIAGKPIAVLHKNVAEKLSIHIGERIYINFCKNKKNYKVNNKKIVAIVDVGKNMSKNEIAVSQDIAKLLGVKENNYVYIRNAPKPKSVAYILEKMNGKPFSYEKLYCIVKDIVDNLLTEAEIAYFISAVYMKGMSLEEIYNLSRVMSEIGTKLKFKKKRLMVDKHSIGGIPNNRTTPIIVSICSAAGLIFPKTSSRAITTAAGTADVIETLAMVEFNVSEIKKIIKKCGACLVEGGFLNLAPADDKIIQIERLLSIDSEPQLLASIISKKLCIGASHILIDIPYGKHAKVNKKNARKLARKFLRLARMFNLNLKPVITNGEQPIGNGVGPYLEMKDVLAILKREHSRPLDLEHKSLILSAMILEMTGKAKKGHGYEIARTILETGLAFKKFKQIIKCQGGDVSKIEKMKPGKFSYEFRAKKDGIIHEINNKHINLVAKFAGCPGDKTAGLYLWKNTGDRVKKGEKIITIYAESKEKLEEAVKLYQELKPIIIKS